MKGNYPSFEERGPDDLLSLSQDSSSDYQEESVLLATQELHRRGLSDEDIKNQYKESEKRVAEEIAEDDETELNNFRVHTGPDRLTANRT